MIKKWTEKIFFVKILTMKNKKDIYTLAISALAFFFLGYYIGDNYNGKGAFDAKGGASGSEIKQILNNIEKEKEKTSSENLSAKTQSEETKAEVTKPDSQNKQKKSELKIISQKEFLSEISREKRACKYAGKDLRCLQVKPEGKDWEFYYGDIKGFDYKEGRYYVLKVKEISYDPKEAEKAGLYPRVWTLLEVVKEVK